MSGTATVDPDLPDVLNAHVRARFARLERAGALPPGEVGEYRVGEAGSEQVGTRVRFELRTDQGKVLAARFRAYGCPWTLAVCDWVAEQLKQRGLPEPPPGGPEGWAAVLGVPLERLGRLLVIEDALLAALRPAEIPEMARL